MLARLSLPLRINLISLVFAASVSTVLTVLGGMFLHQQQTASNLKGARLAADELSLRAGRLLDLELPIADFLGFEQECESVVASDAALRVAALFDRERKPLFHSGSRAPGWPEDAAPPKEGTVRVVDHPDGAVVIRAVASGRGGVQGYALVAVDGAAAHAATLRTVGWLAGSAALLFAAGLVIQQRVFWRTVGHPLAELVRTADSIQPDDTLSLEPLGDAAAHGDDDIGRLYAAFGRLIRRLQDSRADLLLHNELLEAKVQQRTRELVRANDELARDIEVRKVLEAELRTMANTDALTGLANRAFILPYAERRLEQARRDGGSLGLALFDFDGFKTVNDTYGHAAGDDVLRVMGRRIQQVCRSSDALARLGGDEFLLVFEGVEDESQVAALGGRLVGAFAEPVVSGEQSFKVGVSIGIALFPRHRHDLDGLIAIADAAMYRVKQRGGGFEVAVAGAAT